MGASLAVVLANIWMKSIEEKLNDKSQTTSVRIKDPKKNTQIAIEKLLGTSKLSSVKIAKTGTKSNAKI